MTSPKHQKKSEFLGMLRQLPQLPHGALASSSPVAPSKASLPTDDPTPMAPGTALRLATLSPEPIPPKLTPPEKDAWTYTKTLKLVRHILGHKNAIPQFVRIWHKNGKQVQIGMSKGKGRIVLGEGGSFQEAFENLFVKPMVAKMEREEETPLEDS